jgi:HEAT repeat protein
MGGIVGRRSEGLTVFTAPVLFILAFSGAQVPVDNPAAIARRLVDALKDPDPEVRQNLATALAKIGPPAIEYLIGALTDPLPERRAGSAYALGLIGPPAASRALPLLLNGLDDKDTEVRRQVSYAIGRLIPVGRLAPAAAIRTTGGPR